MRIRDLDEAIEAVTRVYCPHTVEVMRQARDIDVRLEIHHATFQPLVELSYGAPVRIDAGRFTGLFLMMHGASGSASAMQDGRTAEWRRGQTMPFSAGCETTLWFDAAFAQRGVRLHMDTLEAQCGRWLGRPLDQPLRFALSPFPEALETAWQRSLVYLQSADGFMVALSPTAKAAFDEFLLTLLLHHQPHNFSDEMARPVPIPVPRMVRRAERFMADNADRSITVSDVADHLGVSLRSLQAGFRGWRNTTPSAVLRRIRLERARDALSRSDGGATVTAVALRYGFAHLGRFSAYYQSAFGEPPGATLRRCRRPG